MRKILFINDANIRSIVPDVLTMAGFAVDTAHDSEDRLELIDTDNYNLIIALANPDSESWQLCRKIRRQTAAPLIVISTNASTETCVQAINAGADFFLRKPFGALELLARVNTLLQRSPRKVATPVLRN